MMTGAPGKGPATLSSGLLARKGQARPAMRSQGFGGYAAAPHQIDDLGWNDMGPNQETLSDAQIVAQHLSDTPDIDFPDIPIPAVLVERAALVEQMMAEQIVAEQISAEQIVASPAAVKPVSVATATRLRRETAHAGKAAFTLRLDADRHLRLRLASAITNRSAQALVAQAFDQLLSTLPEVEILVAQLPPARRRTK